MFSVSESVGEGRGGGGGGELGELLLPSQTISLSHYFATGLEISDVSPYSQISWLCLSKTNAYIGRSKGQIYKHMVMLCVLGYCLHDAIGSMLGWVSETHVPILSEGNSVAFGNFIQRQWIRLT